MFLHQADPYGRVREVFFYFDGKLLVELCKDCVLKNILQ